MMVVVFVDLFMLNIIVCVLLTAYLVLGPFEWLAHVMQVGISRDSGRHNL